MIYVSPVNNHAMVITVATTSIGTAGKVYQLYEQEHAPYLFALVEEVYELEKAMAWLGIEIYPDYKTIIKIEEQK